MSEPAHVASRTRMGLGYVGLLTIVGLVIAFSIAAGTKKHPAANIAGSYETSSACLGDHVELEQSGTYLNLLVEGDSRGQLKLEDERVTGTVTCADGETAELDAAVVGEGEEAALDGTVGGEPLEATFAGEAAEAETEAVERSAEETFARLMLAIAAVILAARLFGALVARANQPRVMGEVLAGILLGPTLLGTFAPEVQAYLFPPDIIPLLRAGANIGLAFYMFLVGLELDMGMLKGRFEQAAFISHGSIAVPMALGVAVAVPIFTVIGPPKDFLPFALFMGVSMSITAFPVLARILVERRMLKRPVGAMAIGAAAVDDVTAWALLALATGVAKATEGGGGSVAGELLRIVGLAILFSAFMAIVVRKLLARVSTAYDEAGHVPPGWVAAIFVGVLLSAYVAGAIPIAPIFGAFVMGLILPRHAGLTHDVERRLSDFVTTVLLPLFFVVAGLNVRVGLLDRPELWLMTVVLILVAIAGKWLGAMFTARYTGMPWRESAVIGSLMNTRGLTELIVLSIGLEFGLVTPALFTMLVIMALVTTFMAGPALRLLDPRGLFSAPPEEELEAAAAHRPAAAEPTPQRRILVTPLDEHNLDALVALAEPIASSEPPRELVIARLLTPGRGATGGLLAADREIARAQEELRVRDDLLEARGVRTRTAAFTSADPGQDILRLTREEDVDLVLVDGRRPLLGEGIPRGEVGLVLQEAPCDVGVLVDRGGIRPEVGPDRPVVVPFGGADHDWAALELAAWVASAAGASLRLLGAEADITTGDRDASRLLANASLVVQQLAGIPTESRLIPPGRDALLEASRDAGLLVIGLSERWREEGLGPVRREIAAAAETPTLFVRRGTRPGALAPRDDVTRFTWSRV